MQNRWCILFPLVQSYQLHWFFFLYPLLLLLLQISSGDERLHFIKSVKEDQRAALYIHTFWIFVIRRIHPYLLLIYFWIAFEMVRKLGFHFNVQKKTNNDIVVGHGNHYHKTKYGRMIFLSSDNVCVWEDDIDGQNYHSISNLRQQENAFDFPIQTSYKMALKNLYLMAASRKKRRRLFHHIK